MSNTTISQIILDMYRNGSSPYEIAEHLKTYPNKIRRFLKKAGEEIRDKSAAQTLALSSGRHKHPTKGTERSQETKFKISEKVHTYWETLPDEIRQQRIDRSKEIWESMSDHDKEVLRKSAALAIRTASKDGSKIENFLRKDLTNKGWQVIFHKTGLIVNNNLEVDLFLPTVKTIIEIDGPTHFLPIWGEESLKKHIKADTHKSGLLLGAGFVIIRVRYLVKNLSEKHKRDLSSEINEILNRINKEFPKQEDRFIELTLE